MSTMRDVARVAGVSAKTVSRVFNDDPHVTAETRERVRAALLSSGHCWPLKRVTVNLY